MLILCDKEDNEHQLEMGDRVLDTDYGVYKEIIGIETCQGTTRIHLKSVKTVAEEDHEKFVRRCRGCF